MISGYHFVKVMVTFLYLVTLKHMVYGTVDC